MICAPDSLCRCGHRAEEFGVGFGFSEAAQQQLHGFDGGQWTEHFAQHPNAAEFVWWKQDFILTSAGALNIDRREDALIREAAVKIDFHIAGGFELFEDYVIHAA